VKSFIRGASLVLVRHPWSFVRLWARDACSPKARNAVLLGVMARLYDCVIVSNELELLEIRLNELAPIATAFVIAEAPVTFQGDPKPLYFQSNRERFAHFSDRIRHIVIDDMPEGTQARDHWRREHHQRNALLAALGDVAPDDFVMLSDVDEIPRTQSVQTAMAMRERLPTVHCFELAFYRYFLNYRHRDVWLRNGPRLTRCRYLSSMQGLRNVRPPSSNPSRSALRWIYASIAMRRPIRRIVHADAGWHFSHMGGVERVAQRMRSGSHVFGERVTNPDATMMDAARSRIESARSDAALRKVPLDASFPDYLVRNQERFRHLLDSY
jgi:beta-1,4-mannosyl-glycoprotein beta-1,4-N-acetylglucosaminyltransferase